MFKHGDVAKSYQANFVPDLTEKFQGSPEDDSTCMFHDTMRLRSLKRRTSLGSAGFSKEEPAKTSQACHPPQTAMPQRPREPPPPPPPVAAVLLPVTPPRKFVQSFSEHELRKINSVIGNIIEEDEVCAAQSLSSDPEDETQIKCSLSLNLPLTPM